MKGSDPVPDILGKHKTLSIENPERLMKAARALSSPLRLRVIRELASRSLSVGELSGALGEPLSSVALAVRTLEEAEIISCAERPGTHGIQKICSNRLDSLSVELVPQDLAIGALPLIYSIPIGGYSLAEGTEPTCGLLTANHPLGPLDMPRVFYSANRANAQMLWFQKGFLEYRVDALDALESDNIEWLEISFEACSEAPMYRNPWPSDIFLELNEKRVGVWTCPCDCGGRQGHLTPLWWDLTNTQFGFLTTWYVDKAGSYLNGESVSGVTLSDLELAGRPYLGIRIGVDPASPNPNGINLFGAMFGDHPQDIRLRVGFSL